MTKYLIVMITSLLVYSCGNYQQELSGKSVSVNADTVIDENQSENLSNYVDNNTSSYIDDISVDDLIVSTHNIQLVNKYGLKPITEDMVKHIKYADIPQLPTIPASHDLTSLMPPVKSQGSQGSCASWSSGYFIKSYQEKVEHGWAYSNSTLMSPAFIYNTDHKNDTTNQNNGICYNNSTCTLNQNCTDNGTYKCLVCQEGSFLKDVCEVLKTKGIVPMSVMPYDEQSCLTAPTSAQLTAAAEYKIKDYKRVAFNDFKTFLAAGNPILVAVSVSEDFSNFYSWSTMGTTTKYNQAGKVMNWTQTYSANPGAHAITVVAYDDSKSAFKIVNSWGPDWGDSGYAWISYNIFKDMLEKYLSSVDAYVLEDMISCVKTQDNETSCGDAKDNDCDGLMDSHDSDCSSTTNNDCLEGRKLCDGKILLVCGQNDNDQYTDWKIQERCTIGCNQGVCTTDNNNNNNGNQCVDACNQAGLTRCFSNGVQVCQQGSSGCLEYVTRTNCASDQICANSTCMNQYHDDGTCSPGIKVCHDSTTVFECSADGQGFAFKSTCASNETCNSGFCYPNQNDDNNNGNNNSNNGCSYTTTASYSILTLFLIMLSLLVFKRKIG